MVSAAAGSGKTAVLVERIIEKISSKEEPVDVDRLLVVTYTHAAANEMKERIRRAIEKKVEEDPGNEHLIRQLSLIHKAQITTITAFVSISSEITTTSSIWTQILRLETRDRWTL